MPLKETIFPHRSNVFKMRLLSGGLVQDLSSVTRMTLTVLGTTVDSDLHSDAFDWVTNGANGEVTLKLGPYLLNSTNGYAPAVLTIYDPAYSEGLTWEESCAVPNLLINVCS